MKLLLIILLSAATLQASQERPTYNLIIEEARNFNPNDFWETPVGLAFWKTPEGKAVIQAMHDYQMSKMKDHDNN